MVKGIVSMKVELGTGEGNVIRDELKVFLHELLRIFLLTIYVVQ